MMVMVQQVVYLQCKLIFIICRIKHVKFNTFDPGDLSTSKAYQMFMIGIIGVNIEWKYDRFLYGLREKILLVNETNQPTRSVLIKRGSYDFFGKIIG